MSRLYSLIAMQTAVHSSCDGKWEHVLVFTLRSTRLNNIDHDCHPGGKVDKEAISLSDVMLVTVSLKIYAGSHAN